MPFLGKRYYIYKYSPCLSLGGNMTMFTQNRVCAFLCAAAALILVCCSGSGGDSPIDDPGYHGTPFESSSSLFSSYSSSSSEEGDIDIPSPIVVPPSIFTMSFNTNGGAPSEISPISLDSGTIAWDGFPSDPVKEGYTFDGWLDETSEIVYTKSTTITKNVTLTAKWTVIESGKATVSFYTDGGIPATIDPVTLDSGETLGAKFPADPERAGYTFGGWFADETQYTATTPITQNVAITAKWIIKTYTISFSRNGGTSATISPVVVDSGSVFSANMPANPTRPGFDFVGWFDSGDNEYTAQSIITGDLTLLARWAEASSSSSNNNNSSSSASVGSSSSNASSSSARSSSSVAAAVDTPKNNYTETVKGVSFDMIYVPGGTFTLGCEKSSGCPEDAKPVTGVKVSPYFIGKTEVTTGLWNAVMDTTCSGYMCQTSSSYTSMTWYDAMRFACKLSNLTGRKYHMTTEAEWEYAAKNHLSSLEKIGNGNEWAYNSWNGTHTGGTDPVGPVARVEGKVTWGHTQKTRRDATETVDHITGRLIRSIEGVGPALRLVVSSDMDYPPNMVPPCDIHAPEMGGEPANSYRDPRWVTGNDKKWNPVKGDGTIAIGNFELCTWEDGTATMTTPSYGGYGGGTTNGQWFTSNNIMFVFVSTSGSVTR
jgi:uncharacterized repeat protein (TIGR02543 family)